MISIFMLRIKSRSVGRRFPLGSLRLNKNLSNVSLTFSYFRIKLYFTGKIHRKKESKKSAFSLSIVTKNKLIAKMNYINKSISFRFSLLLIMLYLPS